VCDGVWHEGSGMTLLTETYADKIVGTLSCFDRVIITGSLVDIAYPEAMAKTLRIGGVRLFDYTRFAEPLRDEVRANAERLAGENGLTIEYIQKKNFRKEERVKALLKERGNQPGLRYVQLLWIVPDQAACCLSPSTNRLPWITSGSRFDPFNERQFASAL
jgi:hypothetical protein